jgi:hypothetical protein
MGGTKAPSMKFEGNHCMVALPHCIHILVIPWVSI